MILSNSLFIAAILSFGLAALVGKALFLVFVVGGLIYLGGHDRNPRPEGAIRRNSRWLLLAFFLLLALGVALVALAAYTNPNDAGFGHDNRTFYTVPL